MSTAASAAGIASVPRRVEEPETSHRDHLRVAPDNRRRRLRARLLMVGIALLTVVALFTLVGFRVVAAQAAFSLDRSSKERMNEQLRYERLREEVAQRSSPSAIISAAYDQGLVFADRKEFIQAPLAAKAQRTPNVVPKSLAPTSYEELKPALDQNP